MPVYLAHGFRWPRSGLTGIRVHAIFHNLEDMSVEYIQNEGSVSALHANFRELFPEQMQHLEDVRSGKTLQFLEQHDPADDSSDCAISQPYAYVADRVITIAAGTTHATRVPPSSRPTSHTPHTAATTTTTATSPVASPSPTPRHDPSVLSLNIDEAMSTAPSGTPQAWEAMAELRDKIAAGEKIGWWIVYNGDPDRSYDDIESDEEDEASEVDGEHNIENYEVEDDGSRTPTQSASLVNGILNQPVPTLLPDRLKVLASEGDELTSDVERSDQIGTAIPHPPPINPEVSVNRSDDHATRPSGSKSFINPLSLRKRGSKSNLQSPSQDAPESTKSKDLTKKEGFRHKFFSRGSDKK